MKGELQMVSVPAPFGRDSARAQMLAFTRSSNLLLASKALPLWPALLASAERGNAKAAAASTAGSQPAAAPAVQLPADCVEALLDLSGAGAWRLMRVFRI